MIYCAPNNNKYIVSLWKLIAYLESTFMNYPGFQFSKHLHFSSCGNSITKFVPLVPLLAEVAETHIDTCISIEICSHSIQSLLVMIILYFELGYNNFLVSICASATSTKSGTSGANFVMLIPQLEKVQML